MANSDFHFGCCKQIALQCELPEHIAHTIACSNQAVDEAHERGYIGTQKKAVTSKHNNLMKYILQNDITREKILCFHFAPEDKGNGKYRVKMYGKMHKKLMTEARCAFLDRKWERLGILLHVIFDQYSHDGFSMRLHPENNVSGLIVDGKKLPWYHRVWIWAVKKPLGHMEGIGKMDLYDCEWEAKGRPKKRNWGVFEKGVQDIMEYVFGYNQPWRVSNAVIRKGRELKKPDLKDFLNYNADWHREAREVRYLILC
ncbi:MAG: DUF6765 family protein [Draconibacterium sp.]|nr:DUF6765 family protein [Draconibacterium sp.]